ncbi:hypothetical protein DFH09DRAFT_1347080 [Mycena vulgaris]|nr:hypothetical protein DFH09DRAFT_1347080 [Mycena vulgaris]
MLNFCLTPSTSPLPSSSSSSNFIAPCGAPLPTPAHRFPEKAQGVPADVREEDDAYVKEAKWEVYEEMPLVASAVLLSLSASAVDKEEDKQPAEREPQHAPPQFPPLPPYTGWHPRPFAPPASQFPLCPSPSPSPSPSPLPAAHPRSTADPQRAPLPPVLPRYSPCSSHAHVAKSPMTFVFARRSFPLGSPSPHNSASSSRLPTKARPVVRRWGQEVPEGWPGEGRLTSADVRTPFLAPPSPSPCTLPLPRVGAVGILPRVYSSFLAGAAHTIPRSSNPRCLHLAPAGTCSSCFAPDYLRPSCGGG